MRSDIFSNFTDMSAKRLIPIIAAAVLIVAAIVYTVFRPFGGQKVALPDEPVEDVPTLYGIEYGDLVLDEGTIEQGQTISNIFQKYGVSMAMVDRTARAADSVFSLRNIRAGKNYTAFLTPDSTARLKHFVYEHNVTDFVVISYHDGDSVSVCKNQKEVTTHRRTGEGTITSSLWNAMIDGGMSPALAMDLSDMYAWTIDFFGLQEGDSFRVLYDERFVDTVSIGNGRIWGAIFTHSGKEYYAIPFKQGDKITYWDENGNSLRKGFLKAPLKFSRISSKFSNSRLHPVLKIRRPHHGVDYAAPMGTPVHAVADGTVTYKGWGGGGGNTVKIKHAGDYMTGYLHLSKYAAGINVGSRVSQGDLIGYVGSTGTSTGPHLDYRVWKNGKAIDPLKVTAEPAEPIKPVNRAKFEFVKDRILAELQGELADSLRITQLDSLVIEAILPPLEVDSTVAVTLLP